MENKKHRYLYGEDVSDEFFYSVYIGKNYSLDNLKKFIKTIEGIFVTNVDLKKEFGTNVPFSRKDQTGAFEEKYKGKFYPFEK